MQGQPRNNSFRERTWRAKDPSCRPSCVSVASTSAARSLNSMMFHMFVMVRKSVVEQGLARATQSECTHAQSLGCALDGGQPWVERPRRASTSEVRPAPGTLRIPVSGSSSSKFRDTVCCHTFGALLLRNAGICLTPCLKVIHTASPTDVVESAELCVVLAGTLCLDRRRHQYHE